MLIVVHISLRHRGGGGGDSRCSSNRHCEPIENTMLNTIVEGKTEKRSLDNRATMYCCNRKRQFVCGDGVDFFHCYGCVACSGRAA
jgi:hypothetical protein